LNQEIAASSAELTKPVTKGMEHTLAKVEMVSTKNKPLSLSDSLPQVAPGSGKKVLVVGT
jgi:hypothetical protein